MESKPPTTNAEVIQKIDDYIMKCKYYPDITIAPGCHTGLNSFYLQMRQELYSLNKTRLKSRKGKLLELFRQDFLRESQELAEVQIGYINTQP